MANTKKEEEKTKKEKSSTSKNTKSNKSNTNKRNTGNKENNKTIEKETEIVEEKLKVAEEKTNTTPTNNNNTAKTVGVIVFLVIFFIAIAYISTLSGKGEYSDPVVEEETNSNSTIDTESESSNISEDEMGELTAIGIDEYLELKANDEKYSVIYIGRPTCSHCQVQLPIMKHLVYKYGIEINYLNTDELDDEGMSDLVRSDEYFEGEWGTPLTLIVKGDKLVKYISGEASIEQLEELFSEYDLISDSE